MEAVAYGVNDLAGLLLVLPSFHLTSCGIILRPCFMRGEATFLPVWLFSQNVGRPGFYSRSVLVPLHTYMFCQEGGLSG
jgi:hypothetical protein